MVLVSGNMNSSTNGKYNDIKKRRYKICQINYTIGKVHETERIIKQVGNCDVRSHRWFRLISLLKYFILNLMNQNC